MALLRSPSKITLSQWWANLLALYYSSSLHSVPPTLRTYPRIKSTVRYLRRRYSSSHSASDSGTSLADYADNSLAVNAWVFFRISGGLFNPAVSLGLVVVGVLPPLRGALLSVSQILGGITSAAIVQALLPGSLNIRTTLGGGATRTQGLFLEMFLTAMRTLKFYLPNNSALHDLHVGG